MKATPAALAAATASGIPGQKLDFAHDSQSRRISKTVSTSTNGTTWILASNQRFLYEAWNLIAEYSAPSATSTSLTLQATHTWGIDLSGTPQGAGGVGGLLATHLVAAPAAACYPAYDGNGNISAWLDATGTLLSRMDYSPFGQLIAQYKFTAPGSTTLARLAFGFSTKYTDAESGLLYYGYRHYDPVNGRWLSRDPIGESGGLNLYEFVKNNGVQILDVLGLSTKWYSYIYGGHGDVDPGSKLENKMHDTENEEGYDKDHSRVSAVSCFNENINSRFYRSIKSNLDQFDDKAIPNSIGGVANPKEPGFLWIDAPGQVTITELANKDSKVTKIGDKYWVYDGADEAYPLMDQKIHDAEDQAEKDAKEYLEKGDNKVCSITIKVSALSYIDIGLGTLDFTKVPIPPGKE